jgi:hypothetical protein
MYTQNIIKGGETMHLSGKILSKDRVIGTIKDGLLVSFDSERLPLYLLRTKDVEGWLRDRAIDAHRTNSRLLKRALRIGSADDLDSVLRVHAATITDTYWFCADSEILSYEDVRFRENLFASLALRGDPNAFNLPYSPTPELTNIGSYEKCWRRGDGKWQMIQQEKDVERFTELFISRLGKALGFPMAEYLPEGDTVVSPDFTDGASVNYESADGLVGDNEDYAENFHAFWDLSPTLAREYLQIIYMDAICFNMDRHTKNYGVLRDVKSGTILSLAPNFDNNIALIARGIPNNITRENDKLIDLFLELAKQDRRALKLVRELPVPTPETVRRCAVATEIPVDIETVCTFVLNGSRRIQYNIPIK